MPDETSIYFHMKILAQCDVPDELANAWLQHLRDFDAAHPGCHFEVMMTNDAIVPVADMIELLKVNPPIPLRAVYELAKAKTPQ
jgi:hypothetical protein